MPPLTASPGRYAPCRWTLSTALNSSNATCGTIAFPNPLSLSSLSGIPLATLPNSGSTAHCFRLLIEKALSVCPSPFVYELMGCLYSPCPDCPMLVVSGKICPAQTLSAITGCSNCSRSCILPCPFLLCNVPVFLLFVLLQA